MRLTRLHCYKAVLVNDVYIIQVDITYQKEYDPKNHESRLRLLNYLHKKSKNINQYEDFPAVDTLNKPLMIGNLIKFDGCVYVILGITSGSRVKCFPISRNHTDFKIYIKVNNSNRGISIFQLYTGKFSSTKLSKVVKIEEEHLTPNELFNLKYLLRNPEFKQFYKS